MRAALVALLLIGSSARADRDYARYEPKGLSKPAPLIVVLHCYGCSPRHLVEQLGLEKLADQQHLLLAIPSGNIDTQGNSYWNATEACCDFARTGVDDVAHVAHVIDDMVKSHGADPKRVYLVGMSNGGFLAHRFACEHPEKLAAFVSISGAAPTTCRARERVAMMEIHGSQDPVVPLAGGRLGAGLPQIGVFPDLRVTVAEWARRGGPAQLWTLPGVGHVPPYDAAMTARIWSFLSAQRRK